MRELMILCAKSNVVCRERPKAHPKVWIAAPGAKRGFLVTQDEAKALLPHGALMYTVALAQGMTPVR